MTVTLKQPLAHKFNKENGARLVDFGGWEMPTFYSSIIAEYKAVRTEAGLFDVSHMGRWWVTGTDAQEFLNHLITNDLSRLKAGKALYSPMLNEEGGIIDDLIIYKINEEKFLLVNNAANHDIDTKWYRTQLESYESKIQKKLNCVMQDITSEIAQIAVQGPKAQQIVESILNVENKPAYFSFIEADLMREHFMSGTVHQIILANTGYTGEAGYELYGSLEALAYIWEELTKTFSVKPCGLGARDLLRLEAGYCLHGNDIDINTTAYEANLEWTVKLNKNEFIGKSNVLRENKKLLGVFFPKKERIIPRSGMKVFDAHDKEIGVVTSGNYSPNLERSIALVYIDTASETYSRYKDITHADHQHGSHADLELNIFIENRSQKVQGSLCEPWFYRNTKEPVKNKLLEAAI